MVLSPGRTEHIEKYVEVIGELVQRGYSVVVHDWRGQGLSARMLPDRLKGHAAGYEAFVADHRAMLDAFEDRLPHPRIALSHSMGGCLTLMAVARGENRFDGMILSAPMLGILTRGQPYFVARGLAWLMTRIGRGQRLCLGGAYDPFHRKSGNRRPDPRPGPLRPGPRPDIGPARSGAGRGHLGLDQERLATRWNGCIARARRSPRSPSPITVVAAGEEKLVDNRGALAAAVASRIASARYLEIPAPITKS